MGKRELCTLVKNWVITVSVLVVAPGLLVTTFCSNPAAVAEAAMETDTVYVHDTISLPNFESAWTWNFFSSTVHDGTSWRMWSPVVSCGAYTPKLFLCHRDSASWRPFDTVKKYYPIGYSGNAWQDGYQILLADPSKLMQDWKWKIVIDTKP